jgi:hypothetical protein
MEKITFAQFFLLMKGIVSEDQMLNIKANVIDMDCPEPIRVLNLATGEWGTPAALGIYDTAYASITALKGGLQTAKILANLDSVLLGDKSSAVQIQD